MHFAAEENQTDTWSARNSFWVNETAPSRRRKRDRRSDPLVLCGHGMSLRIDGGTLVVREGRTHYPQEPQTYRLFPGSNDIPPRIIILDGSGSVSFDVLRWLSEQQVPLVCLNWRGEVVTVAGGTGQAVNSKNVRWQLETRADPRRRLAFAIGIIRQKLEGSLRTVADCLPDTPARRTALAITQTAIDQLAVAPPADINLLRGIEGTAAAAYFNAWRGLKIKIRETARRPVPDAWRRFDSRSSLANGRKPKNRNASDPINAMLNYAYGILQAQVQLRIAAEGFDPTIGIMHHGQRDAPAYAFDLMEPERPKVDAAVLRFVAKQEFSAADFTLRSDGVVRLSPQLARRVSTIGV
ncbi:MAG: CRISPR-associated endonuclease Cas1 [Phenylobacterium sp.]|jgi:CRISPR-associated protein Cas1